MLESKSGRGPDKGELFIKTHKHKDGTPVSKEAAAKIVRVVVVLILIGLLTIFFYLLFRTTLK